MAPQHKDRLSAVDASFLAQEKESAHMHVGAVLVFEGPPPSYDEFVEQVRSRMHLVPRYRQKPLWETWLVQGLERNRFALISKTHHSMIDGVAGMDLASVLFDLTPV